MSDAIGDMLINENNSNILPLGEIPKGRLHLCELGVRLDNQKVAWIRRSVTDSGQQEARDRILTRGNQEKCESVDLM